MRTFLLPFVVVIFLLCGKMYAGWTCSTDQSVPVIAEDGNQWNVRLASDGAGGTIMVWQDRRSGSVDRLYVQRVSGAGELLWQSEGLLLSTSSSGFQYYPQILDDGAGGAYIVWQDNRNGTDYDIYAQRISAGGQPYWLSSGKPVCTASGHQYNPQIVSDAKGGMIVTWQDRRSGAYDIYAQRITEAGEATWSLNGALVCAASADQINPQLVNDGKGGAIFAWTDYRNGTGLPDIYAQALFPDGKPTWTQNGVPVCVASNTQWNVQIVSDGVRGAIISWQDRRSGSLDQIFAQRVDINGTTRWTLNGVGVSNSPGLQYSQRMLSDMQSGAVLVWQDNRSGVDYDIYAQRLNLSGQLLWTPGGKAICQLAGNQYNPQLITNSASAIITWQDRRNGTDFDIYGQRVSYTGDLQWAQNGAPVFLHQDDQIFPQLASDGAHGAIVAWADYQLGNGFTDIFAHRIATDGNPAGGCFRSFSQLNFSETSVKFIIRNRGIIAKPSVGNLRDSIFARGYFPSGIFLGVPRTDSSRIYGWQVYTRSVYVRKTLPQSGAPRPYDLYLNRSFKGGLRNSLRYENRLAAELLTLKMNIAASDLGMTAAQFGDLVFHDRTNQEHPFNDRSLRQVANYVDSVLTYWRVTPANYLLVDSSLRNINTAFTGVLDTLSSSPIAFTAVRPLSAVSFLQASQAKAVVALPEPGYRDLFENGEEPEQFSLAQNYPNPFNPYTVIEFTLPEPAIVSLAIYDILGREVGTLLHREQLEEGEQLAEFDGSDLSSGLYFYRLFVEPLSGIEKSVTLTRKMMLLK